MRMKLMAPRALTILPFAFVAVTALDESPSIVWAGKVVGVTDGDTIKVMHEGKAETIRLHGIDCPESGQPFATVAKQFTSDKCFGKEVTIEVTDTDRYDRTVGNVILPDDKNLNHELVKNGLAWWYKQYAPNDARLRELQTKAILAEIGLWGELPLVAPWDFRNGKTELPNYTPPRTESEPSHDPPSLDGSGSHRLVLKGEGEYTPPASKSEVDARFVPPSENLGAGLTVYVTRTGSKYHNGTCRYLAQSKVPLALKDAQSRGYTPCSVCSPPTSDTSASPPVGSQYGSGVDVGKPGTRLTGPQSVRSPPAASERPVTGDGADTVYITNTGKKFHRGSCRYLSKSKIPISKEGALSQGYGACSVCRP